RPQSDVRSAISRAPFEVSASWRAVGPRLAVKLVFSIRHQGGGCSAGTCASIRSPAMRTLPHALFEKLGSTGDICARLRRTAPVPAITATIRPSQTTRYVTVMMPWMLTEAGLECFRGIPGLADLGKESFVANL